MSTATVTYREVRFVIEDELTHVYVLCEAGGDCPIGVQGWHYKAFGPSSSVQDILVRMFGEDDCVLWPQAAPKR